MTTTTEKQARGFVMTSNIVDWGDNNWGVSVRQNKCLVFRAEGLESSQHAEQIARDIMVRYALIERPTI